MNYVYYATISHKEKYYRNISDGPENAEDMTCKEAAE